jgi:hypothetical protein
MILLFYHHSTDSAHRLAEHAPSCLYDTYAYVRLYIFGRIIGLVARRLRRAPMCGMVVHENLIHGRNVLEYDLAMKWKLNLSTYERWIASLRAQMRATAPHTSSFRIPKVYASQLTVVRTALLSRATPYVEQRRRIA